MNYIAKPWHVLFSCVLAVLGAAIGTIPGYSGAGVFVFFLAIASGAWIVIAGFWAERSRYYDSVAEAVTAASKTDLDHLAALGLKVADVPERVQVDLYSGSRSEHFAVPISAHKMRAVASALLEGQSFTERRWSGAGALLSIGEFRALRATFKAHGLIQAVSDKANQQGFVLTDEGIEFLRAWVSPSPSVQVSNIE